MRAQGQTLTLPAVIFYSTMWLGMAFTKLCTILKFLILTDSLINEVLSIVVDDGFESLVLISVNRKKKWRLSGPKTLKMLVPRNQNTSIMIIIKDDGQSTCTKHHWTSSWHAEVQKFWSSDRLVKSGENCSERKRGAFEATHDGSGIC